MPKKGIRVYDAQSHGVSNSLGLYDVPNAESVKTGKKIAGVAFPTPLCHDKAPRKRFMVDSSLKYDHSLFPE